MKLNKLLVSIFLICMLLFSGCGSVDITSAINTIPEVKAYLEANPDLDLQIVHYSEVESSQLSGEFKANCGKEFVAKDIYRFVVNDQKSLSGVGYYDLNNQVLECFKKNNGNTFEVSGDNADSSSTADTSIVVDEVVINNDGSVYVGSSVAVEADGSVKVGDISVSSDNVVQVGDDIVVGDDGSVKIGNSLYVEGDGNVNMNMEQVQVQVGNDNVNVNTGDVAVDIDDNGVNVNAGNGVNVDTTGNGMNVNAGGVNVNIEGDDEETEDEPSVDDPDFMSDEQMDEEMNADDDEDEGGINVDAGDASVDIDGDSVNVDAGGVMVDIN